MRAGSVFSGIGGLDLAVEEVFGASTAWHCETDPNAAKVLEAHWAGVPNLGDITAVDWSQVEPVDIICGGFPCQDISSAGRGAGIIEGTRSGLWFEFLRCIREMRPRFVVVENVRNLLKAGEWHHDDDACVCGWPDRWGGLHRDDAEQARSLWYPGGCRDDRTSGSPAVGAAGPVRRCGESFEVGDPDVGRCSVLVDDRRRIGGAAAGDPALPGHQMGAGPTRTSAGGNPDELHTCGAATGGLDGPSEEPSEGDPSPDHGAEQEGASGGASGRRMVCPACGRTMGDRPSRPVFRSWFGTVLDGLASVGFDAEWDLLRASAVGACHRRERVFVLAWRSDAHPDGGRLEERPQLHSEPMVDPADRGARRGHVDRCGDEADRLTLLPTPRTSDTNGPGSHGDGGVDLRTVVSLLPTPTRRDDKGRNQRNDASCLPGALDLLPAPTTAPTTGNGHARDLGAEARLLPTPQAADGTGGRRARNLEWDAHTAYRPSGAKASVSLQEAVDLLPTPSASNPNDGEDPTTWLARADALKERHGNGNGVGMPLGIAVKLPERWGRYSAAIARHEHAFGRPAPSPTDDKGRLSPVFVEWMMGYPEGWVTDLLDRAPALRALGNSVVTRQAAAALLAMLDRARSASTTAALSVGGAA